MLEIGKKYKQINECTNALWEITARYRSYNDIIVAGIWNKGLPDEQVRMFDENGKCLWPAWLEGNPYACIETKEYKEPVVHKRDVIWLKDVDGSIIPYIYPAGRIHSGYLLEVHRETITYTEES